MSGILRYGSYVPFWRLTREAMGVPGGKGERAVASYDEDAISMAVEASREALRQAPPVSALVFSTTTAPYAEKLNASVIHAACRLPADATAVDLAGSTRSGITGLRVGLDLAAAGRPTLACASDVVTGAPEGARERSGGDAAVAFVCGSDQESVARQLAAASRTDEVLDTWRTPEMPFAAQWEERFGAEVLLGLLRDAALEALAAASLQPSDLTRVVVDSTNRRAAASLPRALGLKPEQVLDPLAGPVGRTGTAHAGLVLAHALDGAQPGDRIAVFVGVDGAEALVFEVTPRIEDGRPERAVARWIESKRNDLRYLDYLKWRGILPFEPPRRPDPDRPAAPAIHRSEAWKYGFVGSRCTACDTVNLPPQRVCVHCGAVDQTQPEPLADARCRIATYTVDRLAYSLQPPVVAAVVDFEPGGRFPCELTDVDPEQVAIGDELEMTFRRLFTVQGLHNYFWKARPRR